MVRTFRRFALFAFACAQLSTMPARAQGGPPPLTAEERKAAVEAVAQLLAENYVFPELGGKVGAALVAKEKEGTYPQTDAFAFSEALTQDLQTLANDRHLRFRVRPPRPSAAPAKSKEAEDEEQREIAEAARVDHYGFREVRMLPGNVGYLRLDSFEPTPVAGPMAVAAMGFLQGADALVFDLRQNGGGDPAMVQLLLSYLFAEPTHLNDFYERKGDQRIQIWTLPWVPGERLAKVPVYVLTSQGTFSGGEEFAYNLKALKRATIVGETTGGGANPGGSFEVGEHFGVFIPTGRPINPTTGTNWEGIGVEPDVKVPAADALLTAQAAALDALTAQATTPRAKTRLRFARLSVEAQIHPFAVDATQLGDYAGSYGPFRVFAEGGSLYFDSPGGPRRLLLPVATDIFRPEGDEVALLHFERDASGQVTRNIVLYAMGNSEELPRRP